MFVRRGALVVLLPATFLCGQVYAGEVAAEVTMDVVAEVEAESSALALPEEVAEQAQTSAASGLETANEAREKGREFGEERAAQARENRERGVSASSGARADTGIDVGAQGAEVDVSAGASIDRNARR